MAVMTTNNRRR